MANQIRKCSASSVYGLKDECKEDAVYVAAKIVADTGLDGARWFCCLAHTRIATKMRINYIPVEEWWDRIRADFALLTHDPHPFTEEQVKIANEMIEQVPEEVTP